MKAAIDRRIDHSCMTRLSYAVESLLLNTDLDKGLESAFLSLLTLHEGDFPTDELCSRYGEIMEKHSKLMREYSIRLEQHGVEESPALSYLRYSHMNGRTKYWFKERIWELFNACWHYNGI